MDREMHKHISASAQALRKALAVASHSKNQQDPQVLRRARTIAAQLRGALGILEGVGTMQPNWDMTDPDLVPENQKVAKQPQRPAPVVAAGDND
jgi:hypothetical protein